MNQKVFFSANFLSFMLFLSLFLLLSSFQTFILSDAVSEDVQALFNACQLLGIPSDSLPQLDEGTLARAFRKTSFKYHPDKNNGTTTELFQEVESSRQKLSEYINTPTFMRPKLPKSIKDKLDQEQPATRTKKTTGKH